MNKECATQLSQLIGDEYASLLGDISNQNLRKIKILLSSRQVPDVGWNDSSILSLIHELSSLDQNNFEKNVGIGDREGRVFSSLVANRSYFMSHGMGRSGDIRSTQPKALGSSVIVKLCNILVKSFITHMCKINCMDAFVLPVATGMSLSLTLKALAKRCVKKTMISGAIQKQCALWIRIDQKTCFKSILFSGLHPIIVENVKKGDEVCTDIENIKSIMTSSLERDSDFQIVCVISVTSCFAPRAPDSILEISRLCNTFNISHVVNNAFGLQSPRICSMIQNAQHCGRIDAVVQSTDKNIMVPVGGSIVATFRKGLQIDISQSYPGRATISPVIDTFITLLSLGKAGWNQLVEDRKNLFCYFQKKLSEIAVLNGERLLHTPHNPISLAISLSTIGSHKEATRFGSMIFRNCISGCRTVDVSAQKNIEGFLFKGYGSHIDNYEVSYLICSCAIGIKMSDIDTFIIRLQKTFDRYRKLSMS